MFEDKKFKHKVANIERWKNIVQLGSKLSKSPSLMVWTIDEH